MSPQPPPDPRFKTHVRSVFLSDIHLGTADCRADLLLDFLESVQTDRLYLVQSVDHYIEGMAWTTVLTLIEIERSSQ